jgi:hypothetical protein
VPGRDVDTAIRIAHDLTQGIWLGGALMGATALDAAASSAPDTEARIAAIDRAWRRWHRISTPTIVAHLVAGLGLTLANKGRLTSQAGAARTTALRTALTGAAVATEATSRRVGASIGRHRSAAPDEVGVEDDTLAVLQRRLKVAQWANVVTVATMIGVGARMGEQQRPRELLRGFASRLRLAA